MPSNIIRPTAFDVMPAGLESAFTVQERIEILVNVYGDGQSDRNPQVAIPRSFFTLTRPLTPSQWTTLRTFYFAHVGIPFYFYVPRETIPPFSPDPTGQAPDGRYVVVFDSAWSESSAIARGSVSLALREVV
jgi:hypothetical protein